MIKDGIYSIETDILKNNVIKLKEQEVVGHFLPNIMLFVVINGFLV